MYKKIIAVGLLTGIALHLHSQTSTDTIRVIINGQSATIENNGTGKKTTLTFEDSSNVFQVSVIKFSKSNWPVAKDNQKPKQEEAITKSSSTRWFGEGTAGLVLNPFTKLVNNSIFTHDYSNILYFGTGTVSKTNYSKVNPGFRLELFVKEKRRECGKKGLYFISGSRIQFTHFTGTGTGVLETYKTDSLHNILFDSLISTSTASIQSRFRNFKFCVPVILEKQFEMNKKPLSLQGGFLFGLNVNSTRIIETSGPNSGGETSFSGYDGTNFISVQPTVRVLYNNKISFNLTYDLTKSRFGSGTYRSLVNHPVCFSIGYRFY